MILSTPVSIFLQEKERRADGGVDQATKIETTSFKIENLMTIISHSSFFVEKVENLNKIGSKWEIQTKRRN